MNILLLLIFYCAIPPINMIKKILEIRNLKKYVESLSDVQLHYKLCLAEIEKICTDSTGKVDAQVVNKFKNYIKNYLLKINKIQIIKEFIIKELNILIKERISLIIFYIHNGLIVKIEKIIYNNECDGSKVTTNRSIIEKSMGVLEKYNDIRGTIFGDREIFQIEDHKGCITQ